MTPRVCLEKPHLSPSLWGLDPALTFLNHGSFGACPTEVLTHQTELIRKLEHSPVQFMLHHLPHYLRQARERASVLLNADPEGMTFVCNASEGVATALDAVDWTPGDEIIISQDSYPACRHMLTVLATRHQLKISVAHTPFAGEVDLWKRDIIEAFQAQMTPRTRLMLIDQITSPTALCYPVHELVQLAREHELISLVDGAHGPGQLEINLRALSPDFYVGNAHKWLMTPKSCALFYVSPAWRERTFPRVVSHGFLAPASQRFHALFDWTGTRDYSATCLLPNTLDWIEQHTSLEHLRDRNRQLIIAARNIVVDAVWGKSPPPLPPHQILAHMAAIPLPTSLAELKPLENTSSGAAASAPLHPVQRWLNERHFEVPVITTHHGTLLRISAQAYNMLDDYRSLGEALQELQRLQA